MPRTHQASPRFFLFFIYVDNFFKSLLNLLQYCIYFFMFEFFGSRHEEES